MKSDILKFDNNSIETASGIEIASKTALYNGYSKKILPIWSCLPKNLSGLRVSCWMCFRRSFG